MNLRNTSERYSSLSIGLHWLMLLLLAGAYAAINLKGLGPKGSVLRADIKTLHYLFGMTVFALVGVRLLVRWAAGTAPRIAPGMPHWQERFAGAMHLALYAFMIVMPLLGWLALSAKGVPISLFGPPLPALIGPNKSLAGNLKEVHETIATLGYFLIGLHAAAALFHHYVMHDNTLVRMLPARQSVT